MILAANRLRIDLEYHVAGLQSGIGCRRALVNRFYQGALDAVEAQLQGVGRLKRLGELHAQVAAAHDAFFQELGGDALDHVDGNAEGDAAVAARVRGDGCVDADDLAVQVDKRSAARAGVDGGVGLKKVLDADGGSQADLAALAGADDAVRDRLIESKRTADGQHPLANPGRVAVAQGGGRQITGGRQGQDGDVGLRV